MDTTELATVLLLTAAVYTWGWFVGYMTSRALYKPVSQRVTTKDIRPRD